MATPWGWGGLWDNEQQAGEELVSEEGGGRQGAGRMWLWLIRGVLKVESHWSNGHKEKRPRGRILVLRGKKRNR